MNFIQIIAILIAILAHVVFLFFISNKFEKGWLKNIFVRVKENEKGTDIGFMVVRFIVVIEILVVFIIIKGL